MKKLQAIGAPFVIEHSSCSDLKPKHFDWTSEDYPVKVFIDSAIPTGLSYQKKLGEKKIAWICESRAIFHSMSFPRDLWEQNFVQICNSYDLVFTSEKSWVGKHFNIRYCPAGSNLPWAKDQQVFEKTKLVSMIASPKKFAFGHAIRHSVAEQLQGKIDLYGGALESKRIGNTPWDKSEALNDYMFQIVIENDKYETYYTEKITDCFATGVIPIYWGSPDIGDLFNKDGIIELVPDFDISQLTPDLYYSKLEAVKDNFNRVKDLASADDQLFKLINEN
jgi:hypothetical protein